MTCRIPAADGIGGQSPSYDANDGSPASVCGNRLMPVAAYIANPKFPAPSTKNPRGTEMSSGRYTAYHIYQNLSFPEAQKAGTWPYRLAEYQCPHSQRGALFQFDNMIERIHFDAANTSCCNQPVLNFANKPQYADAAKPMNPSDCSSMAASVGCTILEVFVESARAFCAQGSPKIRRIRIQCPSLCPDLAAIKSGGKLQGTYGQFKVIGMEAGEVMVLDYVPDPDVVDGWYNSCSGVGSKTEEFCGGYTVSYTLKADLNYPDGCGCDCCGVSGAFPAPVMYVTAPSIINANWANAVAVPNIISGNQACSGGNLTGTFSGTGSSPVQWEGAAQYHSDGATRFVTRNPDYAGSAANPACCGGTIFWSGTDGCGGGDSNTTVVVKRIGSSAITPPSGTTLYENSGYTFSGGEACSYASSANLALSTTCVRDDMYDLQRFDGYVTRSLSGWLRFSGVHACSGCCGSGSLTLTFNNGCNEQITAKYQARRDLSDNDVAGYAFKCEQAYSGSNYYYLAKKANLYCNGSAPTGFRHVAGSSYGNIAACLDDISGATAAIIRGTEGCSGNSSGTQCCWYSDNGQSGLDFQSRIYWVSGARCCSINTSNGAWAISGAGNECCPHT